MAKRSDLEVSPAQEAGTSAARMSSLPDTASSDPAGLRETRSISSEPRDAEKQSKGSKDPDGTYEDLQSEDAAVIVKMINVASLSSTNGIESNPVHKHGEGSSSQKHVGIIITTPDSSDANISFTYQPSTSQHVENPLQSATEETLHNSTSLNGTKLSMSRSAVSPNLIHGDTSKTQKPKRSGRPDLYDIPQSPPRTSGSETKFSVSRRRGLRPKRVSRQSKSQQVASVVEENEVFFDGDAGENQTHMEYTRSSPDFGTTTAFGGEERTTGTKGTRRTVIIDLPHHVESNRGDEKYQLNDVNELLDSQGLSQHSSPTQPDLVLKIGKGGGQVTTYQAGVAVVKPVQPNIDLRGHFGRKSVTNTSQSTGTYHFTPSKRGQEVEKVLTHESIQSGLQGVSPILSVPTSAKGTKPSPKRLQRPSNRPLQVSQLTRNGIPGGSRPHTGNKTMVISPAQGSLVNEDDDDSQAYEGSPVPSLLEIVSQPRAESATISLDGATMSKMMETVKKAGCNSKGERMIANDKFNTKLGRIFTKGLRSLITAYQIMTSLISAKVVDVGKVDQQHQKVLNLIRLNREKSHEVLTKRLGSMRSGGENANPGSRRSMLADLYIHIIPGLVTALNGAIKSRPDQKTLKLSDLEEFYVLLKVLHELVQAARAEDKSVQPKAPPENRYYISQPTKKLWPDLRAVYKACGNQLIAMKADQLRRTAPARSRKRRERLEAEERLAEKEFQGRMQQRNKAIIASLDERRAELGLPPCSQPIAAISASLRKQGTKYKIVGTIDEANHDMNRRLTGVFGRNNSHPGTTPKEWTKVEMEILVNGLRDERGPTRYEKVATKLERTLDEIFDRAKYLKMQVEYTLKRLQEEQPDKEFPPVKSWIENIGSEGFLNE